MKPSPIALAALFALTAVAADDAKAPTPYKGKPAAIPGVVEAEHFDDGPEGVAFHDVDKTGLKDPSPKDMARTAGRAYRHSTVNVEKSVGKGADPADIMLVGSVREGEWLNYTVEVAETGKYDLELSLAGWGKTPGTIRVEFDGVDKTGEVAAPDTKKWNVFKTVTKPGVELTKGVHAMRVVIVKGNEVLNLDSFRFTPAK